MSGTTSILAGSLIFRGGAGTDGFFYEKIEGLGAVASKRNSKPRANAAGSFGEQGYPDERTVTITGSCWASSPAKMAQYEAEFSALFMDGRGGFVQFYRPLGQVYGYGFRGPEPRFDKRVWGSYSTYQISLVFPDPLLFGVDVNIFPANGAPAASVTAHHYGNYEAAPVYTVYGNMPDGYVLNGPSGFYQVTAPCTSSKPHTINMADGSLTINGARVYGKTPLADTWGVKPNVDTLTVLLPSSGSGGFVMAVQDTYIGVG